MDERVLRFYLGSYVDDPADLGELLRSEDGQWQVNLGALALKDSMAAGILGRESNGSAGARTVGSEALRSMLSATYVRVRGAPPTLEAMWEASGLGRSSDSFSFEVDGAMSPHRRRLHVAPSTLRAAIGAWDARVGLVYPDGTWLVGEHLDSDRVVETTAMHKRADGFWDYFAYDAAGKPASEVAGRAGPIAVPTQCFGCHYGSRLFDPEKSWPGRAPERTVHVPDRWRLSAPAVRLDEHRRRADGVLGIYATLFVSRLAAQPTDSLSEADLALLRRILP